MKVSINNLVNITNEKVFRKIVIKILKKEGLSDKLVSVTFVDPQKMKELNYKYRHKNSSTDVLSFSFDDKMVLGDIYISVLDAQKNIDEGKVRESEKLEKLGTGLNWFHDFSKLHNELTFLLIHGLCHLLGYDHHNDKDEIKMNKKQQELLDYLNSSIYIKFRGFFSGFR